MTVPLSRSIQCKKGTFRKLPFLLGLLQNTEKTQKPWPWRSLMAPIRIGAIRLWEGLVPSRRGHAICEKMFGEFAQSAKSPNIFLIRVFCCREGRAPPLRIVTGFCAHFATRPLVFSFSFLGERLGRIYGSTESREFTRSSRDLDSYCSPAFFHPQPNEKPETKN